MNILKYVAAVAVCMAACTAWAQDTNYLRTQIGVFETRPGVVIVKAIGAVGAVTVGAGELSIGYKQTKDMSTGEKMHGLVIEAEDQTGHASVLLDDDEVTPFGDAIIYLTRIRADVTPLPGFEASYTTKAGLRVIAESVRKDGGVQGYIQFENYPRIALTPVQMAQFSALVQQSRKDLDAVKAGKPVQ